MNYKECLEYIHSVNWCFCKPGLERIGELCKKLGNPQKKLKFVHIAGTNGKGSTSSMLASVLREAGYKVGLYTSPYITVFNERMRINGDNITDDELVALTEHIRPIAEAMTDKPTEFELITALAFEYFYRNKCDVVILEAGMGGRLDSTNIIDGDNTWLSVITGIALDHTAFLGDTVEKIAAEKAGIIKNGRPVLYGGDDESAFAVIKESAEQKNALLSRVDYSKLRISRMSLEGTELDFGTHKDIKISLLGSYQPRNAAVVLCCVDILRAQNVDISEKAVIDGLAAARWQGRFELFSYDPIIIFDGAHNPQGIEVAVESIKKYFEETKVYLLTGVLRDKDYTSIAKKLATVASRAFTITPENPRALSASEYAAVLNGAGMIAEASDAMTKAFEKAYSAAKTDGVPLVCLGSLYVYSTLEPIIRRKI